MFRNDYYPRIAVTVDEAPVENKNFLCEGTEGTMTLTEKHIECAEVCARLEISGQNAEVMARKCGGFRVKRCKTGPKSPGFWPSPLQSGFPG